MTMKKLSVILKLLMIIHHTSTLVNTVNTLFVKKVQSVGSTGGSSGCMERIPSMWINRAAEIL